MKEFKLEFLPETMSGFSFNCPDDFNMASTDAVMRLIQEKSDFRWVGFVKGAKPTRIWVMCRESMVDYLKKVSEEALGYVIEMKARDEMASKMPLRGKIG
jgi:hypothetical protein